MKELTERQKEIASFIRNFSLINGYAPTVRDVAEKFQISAKAAHDHIKALERKQVLKTVGGLSRSMEVIGEEFVSDKEMIELPLLGDIAAGKPIMSEENWQRFIPFPSAMIKNSNSRYYALKVRGESMIEAGIFDGDLAIIKHCSVADNGDIVVASVGDSGGITLKRFFRHPNFIELRAENQDIGPIHTADCQIHGKLYMILRDYGDNAW